MLEGFLYASVEMDYLTFGYVFPEIPGMVVWHITEGISKLKYSYWYGWKKCYFSIWKQSSSPFFF